MVLHNFNYQNSLIKKLWLEIFEWRDTGQEDTVFNNNRLPYPV